MDVNFAFLENWKFLSGIAALFTIGIFLTIKIVRNQVKIKKVIKADNGSLANEGDINAPINIGSNKIK